MEKRIILKWIIKRQDGQAWSQFVWLRRGISEGELL
jgi:hypothetical protein